MIVGLVLFARSCSGYFRIRLNVMLRVPTVMEKHWKKSCRGKSWKMGQENKVMEIENIPKKSWKSHDIFLLLIVNHVREVLIIPNLFGLLQ